MTEIWQNVPGFTGYIVSSFGRFMTYRPKNGAGNFLPEPREIKPRPISGKPYLRVTLTNNQGKQVDRKAHVIVLTVFKGPPPTPEHQTRHLNGNHKDNHESNLVWGLPWENAQDRIDHGTQLRGKQIHLSVLTEEQVLEIKSHLDNWNRGLPTIFAKRFGVHRQTIKDIAQGRTWSHL